MSEVAIAAVFRAAHTALLNSSPSLGGRVYLDHVPASTVMPYGVLTFQADVATRQTNQPDSVSTMTVKVVSDDLPTAFTAMGEAEDALDGAGSQDRASTDATVKLDGGTDWYITTVTRISGVQFTEMVDETRTVYHVGSVFDFRLERK